AARTVKADVVLLGLGDDRDFEGPRELILGLDASEKWEMHDVASEPALAQVDLVPRELRIARHREEREPLRTLVLIVPQQDPHAALRGLGDDANHLAAGPADELDHVLLVRNRGDLPLLELGGRL